MSVRSGTHQLGPGDATLSVRTKRVGAAAKAGHDLLIRVGSWRATLVASEDAAETSIELVADGGSLEVVEGTGGVQSLGADDKAGIGQTIDDEILKGEEIEFRSTHAEPAGDGASVHVEGELTLLGRTEPLAFDLTVSEDGALSATAVVKQSDWGIKPYTVLFGALKVADEVEVEVEGHL